MIVVVTPFLYCGGALNESYIASIVCNMQNVCSCDAISRRPSFLLDQCDPSKSW